MKTLVAAVVAALASSRGCAESRPEPKNTTSVANVSPRASVLVAPAVPPAGSAAPPAGATSAALAASHAPGCDVVVEALLDANVYRGSPSSPAKYQAYRQDPKYARMAQGIDHGSLYLSCTWRVRVNGTAYRYNRASHGGPASGDLRPERCSDRAEAEATATAIASFTDGCKDLHGGEHGGNVLEQDG